MQHPDDARRAGFVRCRTAPPSRLARLACRAALLLALGLFTVVPAVAEEPFPVGRLWQVEAPGSAPDSITSSADRR